MFRARIVIELMIFSIYMFEHVYHLMPFTLFYIEEMLDVRVVLSYNNISVKLVVTLLLSTNGNCS